MNIKPRIRFRVAVLCSVLSTIFFSEVSLVEADVKQSAADGFQIQLAVETSATATEVDSILTKKYATWWDAKNHSYSGKPENMSLDFERGCIYEKLNGGGFVRHMEIVCYQPGKTLRLTGGLGPLQEMGVSGALTFKLLKKDDGTEVQLSYHVSGASFQQLDKIAAPVDRVLSEQLNRLKQLCDQIK